jgi:hypothetical protein
MFAQNALKDEIVRLCDDIPALRFAPGEASKFEIAQPCVFPITPLCAAAQAGYAGGHRPGDKCCKFMFPRAYAGLPSVLLIAATFLNQYKIFYI